MLCGREEPGLGGTEEMLDVVGINYYWNNQWLHHGEPLSPFDTQRWLPFRHILEHAYRRYAPRPIFVAETSIEGWPRPVWFRYVCEEIREAMRAGVPVEGVCLYPVLSHMGWDEERYCPNGLLELHQRHGKREVCRPLAEEVARQQAAFAGIAAQMAA
jgi:hypothetical protein